MKLQNWEKKQEHDSVFFHTFCDSDKKPAMRQCYETEKKKQK